MKKSIISLIFATFLIVSVISPVFASLGNGSEFLVEKNEMIPIPIDPLSDEAIQFQIDAISKDFNHNILPTLNKKQALSTANEIIKLQNSSNQNQAKLLDDDYDEYLNELRQGNFIEGILDVDEGLSTSEIFAVGFTHANEARDAALDEYPNDVMLRDAYRHFSWNYLSTQDIGQYETRTATINHEWGLILLDPISNYYTNQYNDYVANNDPDAANKAFADAVLYLPILKYQLVLLCQNDLNFFSGLFDDSNIMDLHNNCYGRAYAVTNPNDGYDDSFHLAKQNDELILDEDDVGSSEYQYVWLSEWYTY